MFPPAVFVHKRDGRRTLLIHGDKDQTVPYEAVRPLPAANESAGNPCDLPPRFRWHHGMGVADKLNQTQERLVALAQATLK